MTGVPPPPPTLPLGLTNDTVALVLNFNYLIDIVLEQGAKNVPYHILITFTLLIVIHGDNQGAGG